MITTGAICIKTLLMENRTITFLDIWGNKIYDEGAAVISEGLQCNHTLTTLRILDCGLLVEGSIVVRFVFGLEKCFVTYHTVR